MGIKFGEMALIWVLAGFKVSNLNDQCHRCMYVKFEFGDLQKIRQITKLKTSPKFPSYIYEILFTSQPTKWLNFSCSSMTHCLVFLCRLDLDEAPAGSESDQGEGSHEDSTPEMITMPSRFEQVQEKGYIDVWWLYDDGGKSFVYTKCAIFDLFEYMCQVFI